MNSLVDLVLHPIRMRVVMALAGKEMTAQKVAESLGDVPVATLYRHIKRLVAANVLTVVSERRVRGTVEKIYSLSAQGPNIPVEEFTSLNKEEHMRFFSMFAATLMDDFSRYLQHSDPRRMAEDGVGYWKTPLELSDEEFSDFKAALSAVMTPYLNNQPSPDRRRRIFSYATMPDIQGDEHNKPNKKPIKTNEQRKANEHEK